MSDTLIIGTLSTFCSLRRRGCFMVYGAGICARPFWLLGGSEYREQIRMSSSSGSGSDHHNNHHSDGGNGGEEYI